MPSLDTHCSVFHVSDLQSHSKIHPSHWVGTELLSLAMVVTVSMDVYPGTQTAIVTINYKLTMLSKYPVQDITFLLNDLRLQHSRLFKAGQLNRDPDKDNPQYPLIYVLYNFAQSLNIQSSQYFIANPNPTTTQWHARYTRVVTVWLYLVVTVDTRDTPRMCEYCDLLQHITINSKFSTRKRTTECRACAATDDDDNVGTLSTCSGYMVYTLVHQNAFLWRWNEIQSTVIPPLRHTRTSIAEHPTIHGKHNFLIAQAKCNNITHNIQFLPHSVSH